MLPSRVSLPVPLRILNGFWHLLNGFRVAAPSFDEENVSSEARHMVELHDFGDNYYREGLRALLNSIENDTDLNPVGQFSLHRFIVYNLVNRLLLVDARNRSPYLFEQDLIPPIIIFGIPRSGTTFLHRMLANDPAHQAIPLWEMLPLITEKKMNPAGRKQQRRRVARELALRRLFMADLDAKHFLRADSPEECIWMLGLTFHSQIFWVLAPVFGYAEWYTEQSKTKKYEEYRSMLQVLQAYHPQRRLVLKAPEHTNAVDHLMQTLPGVMLVQTHRDPVTAVSSLNSLIYTTHTAVSNHLDVPRMAETNTDNLQRMLERNREVRERYPGVIYDVRYENLTADPVSTIRDIYLHFSLPWTDTVRDRLNSFMRQHPKGRHGAHSYSPADFGQSESDLSRRFATYCEQFGLAEGSMRQIP